MSRFASVLDLPPAMRKQAQAQIEIGRPRVAQPSTAVIDHPNNKFYAEAVSRDGKRFGSKKEYREYLKLVARQDAGEIEDLRVQVKFGLFDPGEHCRGEHWCTYAADFVYREKGKLVVADAKSEHTRRLREWPRVKKMMRACHGHEVIEL